MSPSANESTPHPDEGSKTVCLDCGCEYVQAAGVGRTQHECPICAKSSGRVVPPEERVWDDLLKPRPKKRLPRDHGKASPNTIEVEVGRAEEGRAEPLPPEVPRERASRLADRPPKPVSGDSHRLLPRSAAPPRSRESTEELLDDLRDIGFRIAEDERAGGKDSSNCA